MTMLEKDLVIIIFGSVNEYNLVTVCGVSFTVCFLFFN